MTTQPDRRLPALTMAAPSRREILIGGALMAAAGAGYALQPRHRQVTLGTATLETLVPKNFSGWAFEAKSGLVLPPADQLRDQIYNQLLTRVYRRQDGAAIMLLIAYGGSQDGTIQVHRPEFCYPASGFRLTAITDQDTPLAPGVDIPSRYIVADSELRSEQLIYWTRLGNHFPRRWSEQKLAVIEENLDGQIPDGVLVRISSASPGDAHALLGGFAADLYRSVDAQMKNVLVGRA